MTEIERKYLVKNNSYKMQAQRAGLIVQGYLGDNPLSETRIAIRENKGWLFIKAKGTLSRFEWRQEIPKYEALEFAADNGYMNISSYKGSTNSEWDIMEVYKRVYTDVEEKRKEFPHTAPCGLRYLKDPKYLQSIWSRNAPEPIDDIVQDETIKELDEFGSKEVTFY